MDAPPVTTPTDAAGSWPLGEVVRDIARGGLAGLLVGVLVAGVGGRLVMRLAASLVPAATGRLTDNGFPIGQVTAGGTVGLIVFISLAGSIFLALAWVAFSPWLPGRGIVRGLVAMPVAVAFGAVGLIDGRNPDFAVLRHHPLVVLSLVLLIASFGPAMALADGWLDRRLPRAAAATALPGSVYVVLALIGGGLGTLLALRSLVDPRTRWFGVTSIAIGLATLAWWALRVGGQATPPPALVIVGRTLLVLGCAAGLASFLPDLTGALGVR